MPQLARRMNAVKPSATAAVGKKVAAMKAAGINVLSFSIGVPGFLPPAHVYAAAHAAIDADKGAYFPAQGTPELLKAFQFRLKEDGFDYALNELCTCIGGKNGLYNLMQVLTEAGDEVIFPSPYWTSYPDIIALAGATPVAVPCTAAEHYKLTPAKLQAAITPRTRAFLFNNPNNPTGMLYTQAEVQALADVLMQHPHIWILSDDIYDKMVYDGEKFHHLLHAQPSLRDRTCIVQSLSKTYGMPGWRVGMVAAPEVVMKPLITLTEQALMNVSGVAMAAAAAAFAGDHTFLEPLKRGFEKKRDMTMAMLNTLQGVTCPHPQGAFYAFPNVKKLFGKTSAGGTLISDDMAFCNAMLEEEHVALVPGSGFGDAEAVRISYATSEALLTEGLTRFARFVNGLK